MGTIGRVAEHREKSQMLGDFLREISVLTLVFFPLETYLRGTLDWSTFMLTVIFAGAFLFYGMILEGKEGL